MAVKWMSWENPINYDSDDFSFRLGLGDDGSTWLYTRSWVLENEDGLDIDVTRYRYPEGEMMSYGFNPYQDLSIVDDDEAWSAANRFETRFMDDPEGFSIDAFLTKEVL